MKKLTIAVAFMAVFTLAVCFIMIGAISEELKANLGIDNSDIGTLISIFSITCLIVQLFVGPMVDKYGHKPLAISGFLLAGFGIFLFALAANFASAIVASIFLGIGAICCNTVGNTLLPVVLFEGKEPARASNFGNGFVGLAFVLTPVFIVTLIDMGVSYFVTLSLISVLLLVFCVVSILSSYPDVSTGFQLKLAFQLLSQPIVLLAAFALICYIGLEFSMNTWIKPIMTEMYTQQQSDKAVLYAGRVLGLFGLMMAVGRFATSAIKNLSAIGCKVIAAGSIISILSILLLSYTNNPVFAIIAVIVTGLAFAPMFPTIVGVTFSQYEPKLYGSIFGIIFSVGLIGPIIFPKLIGNVSEGLSVQQSLIIAVIITVALLITSLVMNFFINKQNKAE